MTFTEVREALDVAEAAVGKRPTVYTKPEVLAARAKLIEFALTWATQDQLRKALKRFKHG